MKNCMKDIIENTKWEKFDDISLWKSSQPEITQIKIDPFYLLGQSKTPKTCKNFLIKVNLWYAPEKTNCGIHNEHNFIEIHTQIYGTGRMQKFRENNPDTIYEDIVMNVGTSHFPFCAIDENLNFVYPWHQYYAETDCIWMAIEYHHVNK